MLPFTEEDLGKRRWVIKWIDKFRLIGLTQESPSVEVLLLALPDRMDPSAIQASTGARASSLLAYGGHNPAASDRVKSVRVEVGWINQLRIGLVFSAKDPTVQIPTEKRTFRLTKDSNVQSLRLGKPRLQNSSRPLLFSETELFDPAAHGLEHSHCVVFNVGAVEYIIPRTVLFTAFYGFNSTIANEICRAPWPTAARQLISFCRYESGLKTEADEENKIWYIVVQDCVDRVNEQQLAALWFDKYARHATEEIYNDARLRWHAVTSPYWFCTARLPFELVEKPMEFKVEGYSLARSKSSDSQRFLVTSILSYPWTFDYQVLGEKHSSNSQAEDAARRQTVEGEYRKKKRPVEGSSSARADRSVDPDARSAINVFHAQPTEIVGAPSPEKQKKSSSKHFAGTGGAEREGPSTSVSTGVDSYQSGAPAKADSIARKRNPAQQFDFFIEALEALKKEHVIAYYVDYPPPTVGQLIVRNGRSCWALMCIRGAMPEEQPKFGWEVMSEHLEPTAAAEKRPPPARYSRALLVVDTRVGKHRLLIFEIEPRSDQLRMFCVANPLARAAVAMAEVVDAIRDRNGSIADKDLDKVFDSLGGVRVQAWRHSYQYETKIVDEKTEKIAIGLDHEYMARRISALVAGL